MLFLFTITHSWANDGAYTMSGNQLIPIMESDISIKKEILTIKRIDNGILDVTVNYTFFNPNDKKTVLVGFEAKAPWGDVSKRPRNGQHPHMYAFSVQMNHKKIPYTVTYLTSDNYLKGKIIATPEFNTNKSDIEPTYGYVYHFKAPFKKGLNTITHHYQYKAPTLVLTNYDFDYILTAAARWKGQQIEDFTLILDMGNFQEFYINKTFFKNNSDWTVNGIIKDHKKKSLFYVKNGLTIFKKKNFKIKGELRISSESLFLESSFNYKKNKVPFMFETIVLANNKKIRNINDEMSYKILKNAPYARRGYRFNNTTIQHYYESLDWYQKGKSNKNFDFTLTENEKKWLKEIAN